MNERRINLTEGRTQDLRSFTVQVRNARNEIVGTAFAVNRNDGLLVTCKHVIRDANYGVFDKGIQVWIYFPQLEDNTDKLRHAHVVGNFDNYDDDVVVLQLENPPLPNEVEVAVLGVASDSVAQTYLHRFRSFGYRRLKDYQGLPAMGEIIDFTDKPDSRVLLGKPLMLKSQHIDSGMSGAAVLDLKRNLVVGVITETWDSGRKFTDRDTGFAVDSMVLHFPPLSLPLYDELSLKPSPQPFEFAHEVVNNAQLPNFPLPLAFHNAPSLLGRDWAGRTEMLSTLRVAWRDPKTRIVGLIGFGGEGKSSVARCWLDELLADRMQLQPDGVFWWVFYESRRIETFLEAAITYLGGKYLAQVAQSTKVRVDVIGALLQAGRFLFILDGLEVMQHQAGDRYGFFENNDLKRLLELFAAPGHQSFCLVTSRVPLLDLLSETGYQQLDVNRLSITEGRELMRNAGIKGDNVKLDQLTEMWGGHALTLSLLASEIVERYNGDLSKLSDLSILKKSEGIYEHVEGILHRYNNYLSEVERIFLMLFSAFRTPIKETAFMKVFRAEMAPRSLNTPITALDDLTFAATVKQLLAYRLLRYDPLTYQYTTHPLIRTYFQNRLSEYDQVQVQIIHNCIKDYYLTTLGIIPEEPTLDTLTPLIEAVYHACSAKNYDAAFTLFREQLLEQQQLGQQQYTLTHQLQAHETTLTLLTDFFPQGDIVQEPLTSDQKSSAFILNALGFVLLNLGRLRESLPFHERAIELATYISDFKMAIDAYLNLAEVYALMGKLQNSLNMANKVLTLALQESNKRKERECLVYRAWAKHLLGYSAAAAQDFEAATVLEQEIDPAEKFLYSNRGIWHAEHLRRNDQIEASLEITESNLQGWAIPYKRPDHETQCQRLLGDLANDVGNKEIAFNHYQAAVTIAWRTNNPRLMCEALLARGRWAAQWGELDLAYNDLNEALDYAVTRDYRIHEIDIRIGLAWAHKATGNVTEGRREAERAQQIRVATGYYWGQVDATKILTTSDR